MFEGQYPVTGQLAKVSEIGVGIFSINEPPVRLYVRLGQTGDRAIFELGGNNTIEVLDDKEITA
jgi:hypothetical protein